MKTQFIQIEFSLRDASKANEIIRDQKLEMIYGMKQSHTNCYIMKAPGNQEEQDQLEELTDFLNELDLEFNINE
jgi:hypothetical protein